MIISWHLYFSYEIFSFFICISFFLLSWSIYFYIFGLNTFIYIYINRSFSYSFDSLIFFFFNLISCISFFLSSHDIFTLIYLSLIFLFILSWFVHGLYSHVIFLQLTYSHTLFFSTMNLFLYYFFIVDVLEGKTCCYLLKPLISRTSVVSGYHGEMLT